MLLSMEGIHFCLKHIDNFLVFFHLEDMFLNPPCVGMCALPVLGGLSICKIYYQLADANPAFVYGKGRSCRLAAL